MEAIQKGVLWCRGDGWRGEMWQDQSGFGVEPGSQHLVGILPRQFDIFISFWHVWLMWECRNTSGEDMPWWRNTCFWFCSLQVDVSNARCKFKDSLFCGKNAWATPDDTFPLIVYFLLLIPTHCSFNMSSSSAIKSRGNDWRCCCCCCWRYCSEVSFPDTFVSSHTSTHLPFTHLISGSSDPLPVSSHFIYAVWFIKMISARNMDEKHGLELIPWQ